jgi:large subunit ribosomal protein L13
MPRQTYFAKAGDVQQKWHHVDADGKILGRLATEVASILMGKHRPEYTPHCDTGDFVIVTNAAKIKMTGRKAEQKKMLSYVYYPSGQKLETYESLMQRRPQKLVEFAITRMLPKNKLGKAMAKKLKVYVGPDHPHQSQQPAELMKAK